MTTLRRIRCPTCGADIPAASLAGVVAVCEYCKASFAVERPREHHPLARDTAWQAPVAPQVPVAQQPPQGAEDVRVMRLVDAGARKIEAIKLVRELTGMGLADAKTLVESLPRDLHVPSRHVPRAEREGARLGWRWTWIGAGAVQQAPAVYAVSPPVTATSGTCRVVILDAGHNKIAVIKAIRELSNLGLKEAKDLVDVVPSRFVLASQHVAPEDVPRHLAAVGAVARVEWA